MNKFRRHTRRPTLLRQWFSVAISIAAIFLTASRPAISQTINTDRVVAELEPEIQRALLAGNIPSASIALIAGDRVIWTGAYGYSNLWARTPATPNTVYLIGSTFKAVTISGALQAGLITPSTPFNIPNQIHVADRTIHDDTEHAEETLTTSQILAHSSNVGAIKIGLLEGQARFNAWVHRFGFGARTGVELPGEEMSMALALDRYSGSSMGNLPIGQGELVTPMQMASAYAAIANGGILPRAHIIGAIGGRQLPEPAGRRIISSATAASLRQMLEGVLAPGGTASEVSIPGYQLAGKTGTASKIDHATGEYSKTAYVASFIGFAPASNPKLLCAVVVDEPQTGSIYGGRVAAPAFGQIMSFALPYLRIPPG